MVQVMEGVMREGMENSYVAKTSCMQNVRAAK